jgi:hypothetical protein
MDNQHAANANDHITLGELYNYIGKVQIPYTYELYLYPGDLHQPHAAPQHPAPLAPPRFFRLVCLSGSRATLLQSQLSPHFGTFVTDVRTRSNLLRTSSPYRIAVTVAITYCTAPSFELVYSGHEFQYFTATYPHNPARACFGKYAYTSPP